MGYTCKKCGGPCSDVGGGRFECQFCGSTFERSDFGGGSGGSAPATKASSGADVFEQNINGILEISCIGKDGAWSGSGYIVSRAGFAITNAHVAANDDGTPCTRITVKVCNQKIPATVVALADDRAGSGSGVDLAIIRLSQMPYNAKALTLENSDNIRNGEAVYVIGNSLGHGTCITSGIVSDKLRNVNGKMLIMTDCAVNGGNSGGPIFNQKGLVIGTIVSQGRTHNGSDAEGMNYAIPANTVSAFLKRYIR